MLKRKLVLEEETAVFILVNFADLVLTGVSFYYGGWELNPFANYILDNFGLRGMAFYKFILVTFVILIAQFVYPSHPKTARMILLVGSIAFAVLIAYILILLLTHVFSTL